MNDQIEQYDGLVRRIARRYHAPVGQEAIWTQDAIQQEGRIGVWNALRKYDPDGLHQGYSENTIVAFGIKAQIRKALRAANHGMEPIEVEEPDIAEQPTQPLPIQPPSWMQSRITRELEALPSHEPDVEEAVITALDGAQVSATLEAALLLLTARQRAIIERRYGLSGDGICWTQEEVGRYLGIHKSNVCRTQRKALAVLREHLGATSDGALVLIQLDEKRQQKRQRRTKKRAAA